MILHFSLQFFTSKQYRSRCEDPDRGKDPFQPIKFANLIVLSPCKTEPYNNACYVGETTRHFSTREREHLGSEKAPHIFKHLQNSEHCPALCSVDCFHILDHASMGFQVKMKEAFHIQREQPSLNQQLHHVNLKLSL